jgi:hypothetical protein
MRCIRLLPVLLLLLLVMPAHAALLYNFNGSDEGWTSSANINGLGSSGNQLVWNYQSNSDPIIVSPSGLSINTAVDQYFVIDLTFNPPGNVNDMFQVFFNVGAGFNEPDSQTFTIMPGRHQYRVFFGGNADWSGTCTQFRIDPGGNAANFQNSAASINWMGFVGGPAEWEFPGSTEGWGHANYTDGGATSISHDAGATALQVNYGGTANSPGDVVVTSPTNSVTPGVTDWVRIEMSLNDPDANTGEAVLGNFQFPTTGGFRYFGATGIFPNLGDQVLIWNSNRADSGPGTAWGVDTLGSFRFDPPNNFGADGNWNNADWDFDAIRFLSDPADAGPYSWNFGSGLQNWTTFPYLGFAGTAAASGGRAVITGSGTSNVRFGNFGTAIDTVAVRKLSADIEVNRTSGSNDLVFRLFFENDAGGLGSPSIDTVIPVELGDGVSRSVTFDIPVHTNTGSRTWGTDDNFRYVSTLLYQVSANGNDISSLAFDNVSVVADSDQPALNLIERQSPATAATNAASVTFLVGLTERVANLDATDFTVAQGAGLTGASITGVTPLASIGGYAEYALVTVGNYSGAGTLGLDVAGGTNMVDALSNGFNTGAAPGTDQVYNVDVASPAAQLVVSVWPDPTNGSIIVPVDTGESTTSFTMGDITTSNATVIAFTGSGSSYQFELLPTADGPFSCQILAGAYTDAVGNPNTASNIVSLTYDGTRPTVTLSAAATDPVNGAVSVSVTTSEFTTDFDAGDITPTNATVTGFSGSGVSYSFNVVPQSDGLFSAVVNDSGFTDEAGNFNTVSNTLSRTYDGTVPTVSLSSVAGATVNGPITVDVTIGESVTTFGSGNITPTNATVSGFSGSGDTYSFTLTPTAEGNFSAVVSAAAFQDAAGNDNAGSNVLSRVYDATRPVIQTRTPDVGAVVSSLSSVVVTFDEPVMGVDAGDLLVKGSPATAVSGSSPGPFTFSGFPAPSDGSAAIVVQAGGITDDAGNLFLGDLWNITVNSTVPTVQIASGDVTNGGATNSPGQLDFTATFSEAVSGFNLADIQVSNATKGGFSGTGANYTFTVAPLSDGTVTVEIPASAGTASAPPNNASAGSGVFSFTFDATAPVVTLSGSTSVSVDCGDGFTDPGVQNATDNLDGDLTSFVSVGGDMVTAQTPPGNYTVTYSVTDDAGNVGMASRSVEVIDNCPLAISGVGAIGGTATGPSDFTVDGGQSITLQVSTTGAIGALTYDWQKDTGAKAFTTLGAPSSPSFVINGFNGSDAGAYRVVVSDAVTSVTSPTFTLTLGAVNMPVAGGAGLGLLAAFSAAAGAAMVRRRNR